MGSETSHETAVIDWFLEASVPPRLRGFVEWAESELKVPNGPFRGYRYKVDRLPYARLLLNELGKWRVHVVTGPVQSGKTLHAFVLVMLYYLFEMQEDVVCGLPDIAMSGVKWESDIKPVILASSYADQLPESGDGSRGGKPTQITFKNGRTLLFMGGGGSDNQRAGATAKVLAVTEADKLDVVSKSSKEGQTKLEQLKGRVRSEGLNARLFFECTLSDDQSFTHLQYSAGTASRIACPCVHCGEFVTPERENFVGWDGAETAMEAGRKAAFTCPECGGFYTESHRREMNIRGRLIHKGQSIDKSGTISGPLPDTDTLGFRWNAFNNLLVEAELVGRDEWEAKYGSAGNEDKDRPAEEAKMLQQVWARPVTSAKSEDSKITAGIVRGSALGYHGRVTGWDRGFIPPETTDITAFIDMGKRVLTWAVYAWLPGGRAHVVDYGFFETSNVDIVGEEAALMDALPQLMKHIEQYPIDIGIVDSGWRNDIVFPIVLRNHLWRASKGVNEGKYRHPKEATDDRYPSPHGDRWFLSWQPDHGIWQVDFDPDWWKHRVHGMWMVQPLDPQAMPRDGSITIFGDSPTEHLKLADEIVAEKFERRFVPGRGFIEGFVQKHADNHQLDVSVGLAVGHSMVRARRLEESRSQAAPSVSAQVSQQAGFATPGGQPFLVTER